MPLIHERRVVPTVRTCRDCGSGDLASQNDLRRGRRYFVNRCRPCLNEYHRARREANPERAREIWRRSDLKRDFGITPEQYDEILVAQSGVCLICLESCASGRRLAVDHDHETNEIRGLLCANCNRAVGLLQDDSTRMERAASYLRRPPFLF